MSKLLRAFRSSLEADPGPWLLGASAILAVALWNLPIPAFLFAQAGSGSAPPCKCKIDDLCVNWAKTSGDHDCAHFEAPWEECRDNLGNSDAPCPAPKKHRTPLSKYVYEKTGAEKCTNNQSHQGEQPEHHVTWKRTVKVKIDTAGAKKTVKFEPVLDCIGTGFHNANVCQAKSSISGSIRVKTGLFAKLIIEGNEAHDGTKPGPLGWHYREDIFQYDAARERWGWAEGGPFTPADGEQFNIAVAELPCRRDENADEIIEFKCQIEQMGRVHTPPSFVYLGDSSLPVEIVFSATDKTECNGF